jgi:hypothetical protein
VAFVVICRSDLLCGTEVAMPVVVISVVVGIFGVCINVAEDVVVCGKGVDEIAARALLAAAAAAAAALAASVVLYASDWKVGCIKQKKYHLLHSK